MGKSKALNLCLTILLSLAAANAPAFAAKTIYIDADATGANNGSSWTDAYNFLQDALTDANSSPKPVEICVAQGVYTADSSSGVPDGTGDREATFQLISGVSLKGGYAGFGQTDPNARDVQRYETILSGDLKGNDVDTNDPSDLLSEPTREDNAYHILTFHRTDGTTILDGFTVSGGNATGWYEEPTGSGGAIICTSGSLNVINCRFTGNSCRWQGGAIWYTENGEGSLRDCFFAKNYSRYSGGAVFVIGSSWPIISECTFVQNSAGCGGAIHFDHFAHQEGSITRCTFNSNSADSGGAVFIGLGLTGPTFTCCVFKDNLAETDGGAVNNWCPATFVNCTFRGNLAGTNGGAFCNEGAGEWSELSASPFLRSCVFMGNSASNGGAMWSGRLQSGMVMCYPSVTSCVFTANTAINGGAIYYCDFTIAELNNCLFTGNRADSGGAILTHGFPFRGPIGLELTNCTFGGNAAEDHGGAISNQAAWLELTHSILWDDTPDEINPYHDFDSVEHNNIKGGWPGNNIDVDPCFADPGYWDANGTPDDANDDYWVEGDYNLKSQAGRNDPNEGRWTIDEVTSPCIDAGDPMSPIGLEPFPNGGIINMGAYGGTAEASKSYFGTLPCETLVAGDINGDCAVDFKDFTFIALHWLTANTP